MITPEARVRDATVERSFYDSFVICRAARKAGAVDEKVKAQALSLLAPPRQNSRLMSYGLAMCQTMPRPSPPFSPAALSITK
jgi:hypothetical protein